MNSDLFPFFFGKTKTQVSIFYDSILMCQHYVMYPDNKKGLTSKNSEEINRPLVCESPIDQQTKGSVKCSYQSPAEV